MLDNLNTEMGNSIKPQIENAQKTGTCNLSNKKLTEVKISIQFKNLVSFSNGSLLWLN